ncbi:sugar-transfer associated ATP-grasp domain-containing protein [Oceanobacillus jeddahense]|uniref:sugar-transfer associated ATP-grasp domain-containing protein n=1 Tax=Oceanobacillus jeddahense TaxID=1462527 RepID=UPI000595D7DB|nr:sugar-transfer associated ATP-grasp domain-containing protein [Oceanobacillus jeddahense]
MSKVKYINERLNKIKMMMNNFIEEDLNVFQKTRILADLGLSIFVYGSGINDYFQYQFYKRKHIDRKNFVVHRKRMRIVNTFNNKEDRKILDSKNFFNKKYNEYVQREWLDVSNSTFEEFNNFTIHNKKFIVKPIDGSHGKGIRIVNIDEAWDLHSLYEELIKEKPIIEELIVQNEEIAEFNPTSVNTLRVVSLVCPDGEVRIMTANFRVGNGERFADNFHHNGIAALLNVDTGIVVTSGIDMNFNRYLIHPESKKQILGFRVPYWNEVIKTVKKAARVTPTVGYIGWDVAIGKNGEIIILEGNAAADPDISQMPDQIGKWPLYEQYVLEKQK